LGYQNNAQEDLFVCFNGLPTYTTTLKEAMATSVTAYENIGVEKAGVYNQLNTNLLQIENEYYSDVRPKRNSKNGEKPLTALNQHGVEYIEVRCLDLNPFLPLGLDKQQSEFMDLFLAYCLLHPSPDLSSAECKEVAQNQHDVVLEGRKPGFELKQLGESISLKEWAQSLLLDMGKLASVLDAKQEKGDEAYQSSLDAMMQRVKDVNQTPSAKMLNEMKSNNCSFTEFGLNQAKALSKAHKQALSSDLASEWSDKSEKSLKKQQDIESLKEPVFADFLSEYLQAP
jgi:glutamate--cysteine ligase